MHNNAIVFGTATSDTPNVCETLLTSYTYILDVKDISKPVALTLYNGVGSGVNFLFRVMQIDISRVKYFTDIPVFFSISFPTNHTLVNTCAKLRICKQQSYISPPENQQAGV